MPQIDIEKKYCSKCPLYDMKKKDLFVLSEGSIDSGRVIIGQNPGREEVEQKRPFVGQSGELLRQEIKERDCYITNAVKCYTPENSAPPSKSISLCREAYLDKELSSLPPGSKILALGNVATHSLYRKVRQVKDLLGLPSTLRPGVIMLPTYHPSAYLHTHDRRYLEALQMGIDWLFSNRTLPQISFKEIDFIPSKYLDTPYVLDIETPWGKYLGDKDFKINAIGILSLASDTAYILKNPRELSKLNGLCIGHNLVYDFSVLSHFGIKLPKKAFDTIIALKLLRPFEFTYRLKSWVSFMGYPHYWEDFYNSEGKVPKEYLYKYLAYDLYMTRELYNLLDYELNTNWTNLMPIIELYQDLLPSVGRMVGNGLTVDIDALNRENEKIESEVSKIETHFKDLNINLNSPKQLLQYLHSLGFRERRTSEEALKSFNHPVSKLILKRRKLLKVKDTYIDPLLERSKEGRIYSDCMVHGTLTGRFTRHDPPVQTIPRAYRSIFRSRSDDHVLLSVDFDQIEFRLIADVSKEGKLYDVTDIHTETASRLGLERDIAKTLNYAVIYGAHAQRISETGGISYQEAERLIRDFYQIFPRIKKFIDKTHAQVVDKKYVSSPFGRYWDFSHIESDEMMHKIQRQAVNYIIQSMAHDILMVYWNLLNPLLDKDILVINDVHDELVLDVPQKKLDKAKNLCYNALRKVKEDIRRRFNYDVKVPITISFSVGRNWSK